MTPGNYDGAKDLRDIEVLVIGGGNAVLCAAIGAAESGAGMLVWNVRPLSSGAGTTDIRKTFATPTRA